jgi:uncharacterized membrane-anchored protein YitT (DUF2179 family)
MKWVVKQFSKHHYLNRGILLVIGSFLAAIAYNAFILPNNIVKGGLSGVTIIVGRTLNIDPTFLLNIGTFILAIVALIICGYKKTIGTAIGYITYALMVAITAPLVASLDLHMDSLATSIAAWTIIGGVGGGLIYYAGFDTGGIDSVIMILQKYIPLPYSTYSMILNSIIIVFGAFTFGIDKSIIALLYLRIENIINKRMVLGSATSKLCFIRTRNNPAVEEYLKEKLEIGYSLLSSTNGISVLSKNVIMCLTPTEKLDTLKNRVKKIDKKCMFISINCYTSAGGTTNKFLAVEGN